MPDLLTEIHGLQVKSFEEIGKLTVQVKNLDDTCKDIKRDQDLHATEINNQGTEIEGMKKEYRQRFKKISYEMNGVEDMTGTFNLLKVRWSWTMKLVLGLITAITIATGIYGALK